MQRNICLLIQNFFFLNYILHDSKSENFAKERLSKVEKTKYSAPHINDKFVSIEKKSKYSLKKIDYCLFLGFRKKILSISEAFISLHILQIISL